MKKDDSETKTTKTKGVSVRDKNLTKDKAGELSGRETLIFSKMTQLEVRL